jgi:hypothetical protein
MLNVEELNLLLWFDVSTQERAVADLRHSIPHMDDPELMVLGRSLLKKLEAMTQEEWYALDFTVEEDMDYAD